MKGENTESQFKIFIRITADVEGPFIHETATRRFLCLHCLEKGYDWGRITKLPMARSDDMTREGIKNVLDLHSNKSFARKINRAQLPVI